VIETGNQDQFERLYKQGNVEKWLYVMLAKLEDGLTASFHDISDLKKYEEELKKNILQLQHSNKELEEYAYVASHDLQEPLRKIMTYASLLENSQSFRLDDKGKSFIGKMMSSAQRMSVLIRDILNFSGMKPETAFVKTSLNEVLDNVLEDLELVISQKEAVVHVEKLPAIEAIPLQVHQLFYNLISNALKFTREGVKPEVFIKSRELPAEETSKHETLDVRCKYCEITVTDNGIGFNEKYSDQIFGLFKRLNDKKEFTGSGIGLALCRKVAANHHGDLYASGKEGEGATFYIIMPLKQ
jgi:light-regulated signal transduction histidine kinase (bacteriophytochrome)